MGGFFGVISKSDCVKDVFYGTDYHSHLGTKRAGLVFIVPHNGFRRSIHSIENSYFRNKFENELDNFTGKSGLGVIQKSIFQIHSYLAVKLYASVSGTTRPGGKNETYSQ
jgi:hypothetical protein